MTDEELQQFAALAKKYERTKDKAAVLKVVQEDLHEVFQDINDGGRTAANAAWKEKLDAAELKVTNTQTELSNLQDKLKDVEKKTPDLVKLREKYEDDITKLKDEHDKAIKAKDKLILDERVDNEVAKLVDELAEGQQIDREYAATILARREDVRNRLKPDDKGKIGVLKKGETQMFLVPSAEKSAIRLLAEELAPEVAPKWKTSNVKKGSGMTTDHAAGSGGGGGKTTEVATRAEQIREEEKARQGQSQKQKDRPSGAERLRGGR